MKRYLVIYNDINSNQSAKIFENETQKEIKETLKGNNLKLVAILNNEALQEAESNVDNKHYFLIQDLKGNGMLWTLLVA